MSQEFFKSEFSERFYLPDGFKAPFKPSDDIRYFPRSCLEYSDALSAQIRRFFLKIDYPYRNTSIIPFEDPIRSEIRYFLLSLDAYIESENPVIPEKIILFGSLKKDFSDELKKIKRKSFEESWKVEHFALPDWYNDCPYYQIDNIGQIFKFSYLIHWKDDEPEDYKWGLVDVEQVEGSLDEFRQAIIAILPDLEIDKVEDLTILSQISASRCFNSSTRKKDDYYKLKPKRLFFNEKRSLAKRSIIYVSPNNCRDSILLDPADHNTILWLDTQMEGILRHIENHVHLKDQKICTKRYKLLAEKYTYFLQRDIKKEGITKPKNLIKIMIECLDTKYPELGFGRFVNFYDNYEVELDDHSIITMKRGHGLGMANGLTTLMNLAIHEIVCSRISDNLNNFESEPLALNDDFVAGFHSEYEAETYWDEEEVVMKELGLLRAPDKSFLSKNKFVLAERYFHKDREEKKDSFEIREVLITLAAANIAVAKQMFLSTQVCISTDICAKYFQEIIDFWGYEFFEDEVNYPYAYGGWIGPRFFGCDLSLLLMEGLEFNSKIARAFEATQANERRKFSGDIYKSPLRILYGDLNEENYNRIFFKIPIEEVKSIFRKNLGCSTDFIKEAEHLVRSRKRIYKQKSNLSYLDTLRIYMENSKGAVMPNRDMINGFDEVDQIRANIDDLYIDPNPILSLLSYFGKVEYDFQETYSINFVKTDNFKIKFCSDDKAIQRVLSNETIDTFVDDEDVYLNKPRNYKCHEDYLNPVSIGIASSIIFCNQGYPILKKEFRSKLLKEKSEVFGRLLHLDEQIFFSKHKIRRKMIKFCIGKIKEAEVEDFSLEDFFEEIVQEFRNNEQKVIESNLILEKQRIEDGLNERLQYDINYEQLSDSEASIFYQWRNDRENYQISNPRVLEILTYCDFVVTSFTAPFLPEEDKEELYNYILSSGFPDAEKKFFVCRLGLLKLFTNKFDSEDEDEDGFGFDDMFG